MPTCSHTYTHTAQHSMNVD